MAMIASSAFGSSTLESARLMLQLHDLYEKISTLYLCIPSYVEGFDVYGHDVYLFLLLMNLHKKGC